MNDERNPLLESLFTQAGSTPADDKFIAEVMASIDRRHRNVFIGRIAIVTLLVAFELMMASPMQNFVGIISEAMSTALVEVTNEWLSVAVAPVNSVAGLMGLLLLGMHTLYRRMVR